MTRAYATPESCTPRLHVLHGVVHSTTTRTPRSRVLHDYTYSTESCTPRLGADRTALNEGAARYGGTARPHRGARHSARMPTRPLPWREKIGSARRAGCGRARPFASRGTAGAVIRARAAGGGREGASTHAVCGSSHLQQSDLLVGTVAIWLSRATRPTPRPAPPSHPHPLKASSARFWTGVCHSEEAVVMASCLPGSGLGFLSCQHGLCGLGSSAVPVPGSAASWDHEAHYVRAVQLVVLEVACLRGAVTNSLGHLKPKRLVFCGCELAVMVAGAQLFVARCEHAELDCDCLDGALQLFRARFRPIGEFSICRVVAFGRGLLRLNMR